MRKSFFIAILASLVVVFCSAQPMDNTRKVDTLSILQRMSFRANIPDWSLTVPGIGGEFDIRRENWNRWSAGFYIRWRPQSMGDMVKPFYFNLFEVTLEGREYWRERKATATGYLSPHRHWWQKILSCRNMMPSHPNWIFYRGGYVSYANYSTVFGRSGHEGTAVQTGFTWGFVKPFKAWNNGISLDWEFGFSAGIMFTRYDTFDRDDENNCYTKTGHVDMRVLPMLRDIHAAIVMRLGNYPIQKKYRWRYDVDNEFRARKDAQYSGWVDRRDHHYRNDSIYKKVSADFCLLYDSCVNERHKAVQRAIDARAPKRKVVTPKKAQLHEQTKGVMRKEVEP